MPAIRLFERKDDNWIDTNPVTGEKEIVDEQEILDSLDIKEENEDSQSVTQPPTSTWGLF